jgi:hypothetical protein
MPNNSTGWLQTQQHTILPADGVMLHSITGLLHRLQPVHVGEVVKRRVEYWVRLHVNTNRGICAWV